MEADVTERLPDPDFLDLVRPFTGPVTEMRATEGGFMSDVLVLVDGDLGRYFVKGVRSGTEGAGTPWSANG
ncbi:hypothetical protein [Streptomyces sp. NPDC047315]|uniref:hypothetical protein n=1 Tax=Streptomyces sp. NPDC047315 TaxID=3155142 RepID=UPI003406FC5E